MPPAQETGASQDFAAHQPRTDVDYSNTGQSPIGEATAPNGMQPGNLNSNNPLNSGTTASVRLAELIAEDIKSSMGPGYCTEHMKYDGCNPDDKTYQKLGKQKDSIMTYENIEREVKTASADTKWFDGTSESIFARLDRLQDILDRTRTAASHPNVNMQDLEKYSNIITSLGAEKEQLEKIASEYVDFDAEEYLNNLPGGTIAKEYRISSAGTFDLGEDDGSLLYKAASGIQKEFDDADWIGFVTAGAEIWVEDQNAKLLRDQIDTREAAIFYVEKKTAPILDSIKRASIIDNFVDNVEICRRQKNDASSFRGIKAARMNKTASQYREDALNESFGDSFNWLQNEYCKFR